MLTKLAETLKKAFSHFLENPTLDKYYVHVFRGLVKIHQGMS